MAHVLIAGSADRLRRAAAERLLGDGHEVIVHARSAERLAAVEAQISRGASVVVGDLPDLDQTRSVADQVNRLSPVDAVIDNAGVMSGRHILPRQVGPRAERIGVVERHHEEQALDDAPFRDLVSEALAPAGSSAGTPTFTGTR